MMNLKDPLMFVGGAAVGSLVTWLIVKEKYKAQAQEEIDSVKEVYAKIHQEAMDKAAASRNKPDISLYTDALKQAKEKEEPKIESEPEVKEEPVVEEEDDDENYIYEITTTDFSNSLNGHTKITITCFSDHVFADEMYERVNPREYLSSPLVLLGSNMIVDPVDYIYRMPKDEICIRNYELKLDIDVATDGRSYSDYMSS